MEDPLGSMETIGGIPRIGDPAPNFEAESTFGNIQLADFRGSWLVLFSHPADFTPVCTTEFLAFARRHADFRKCNTELLGVSIDSIFAHLSWVRNIEEKFGCKITFPVVADIDRRVAMRYGMIMPGESRTETSRCVFVIDPNAVIRALTYYPMTTGRNVDEILRLVTALQTSDTHMVATPANWQPGDPVIVPPPRTQEAAAERLSGKYDCKDWYFCQKKL